MKWKNRLKYWVTCIAFSVVALTVMYVVYELYYNTGYFDSVNSIITLAIGLISFIMSVVALIFSVVTYISIDSVNALSSMEGNVLSNENYNAEYMLLVKTYADCDTQVALREKLIQDANDFFQEHSRTCMEFTDTLQFLIDRLLWFAYVDTKNPESTAKIAELIEKLEKKYHDFNAISNGNQYVLREHIKLIKNVLNYQSIAHDGKEIDANGEMLNIRGRMLVNSVSKTIYYDYLGLEYYKKALERLKEITQFSGEEFVKANMEKISTYQYSQGEKMELDGYLKEAQAAFDNAVLSSENDVLWKGYISFNKARVDLLRCLVNNDFSQEKRWDESICKSIENRYFVKKVFLSNDQPASFLELEFVKEHFYAEALYLSVLNFRTESEAEREGYKAKARALQEEICAVNTEGELIFKRTNTYLEDIIAS